MINIFSQNRKNSIDKKQPDGKNGPFRWIEYSFTECLLYLLSDPVYPISAILLLIYACTGMIAEAYLVLILILIKMMFAVILRYIGQKKYSGMNSGLIFPVKGEKEGNNVDIYPWNAEDGDVLILKPGVIVPADCEIVSQGKIRVMEPYFDYDAGRRATRTAIKFSKAGDDVPNAESRIVYAGSTILSGQAKAVVFSVGLDTSASSRLGGLKIAPSERYGSEMRKIFKIFGTVSVILLIAVIPSMLLFLSVYAKSESQSLGLLPAIILLFSMICGCVSGKYSSYFDYIISNEFKGYSDSFNSDKESGSILIPSVADDIAMTDTLMVFDKSVFGDLRTEVRSVFFDAHDYSGDMIGAGDLNGFAERALVISAVAASQNQSSPEWEAFESFADLQAIDRDYMLRNVKSMTPVLGKSGSLSVKIVYRGEKTVFDILSATLNPSVVVDCRYYRQKDGSLGISGNSIEEKASEFVSEARKKCQIPVFFTTRENNEDALVLEGVAAVGGVFPDINRDVDEMMQAFGINTILVIPDETSESLFVARMSGIADDDDLIAVASEYAKKNIPVTDGIERKRAFIGFGKEDTEKIIDAFKKDGANICSVPTTTSELRSVNGKTTVISVAGSSSGAIGLSSSAKITRTVEQAPKTGLSSFFSMVLVCVNSIIKSKMLKDFLFFRTAMLVSMILIPFWAGKTEVIPSSFWLMFGIIFTDIVAVFSICLEKLIPESRKQFSEIISPKNLKFDVYRYIATGVLSGIGTAVIALVFSDNAMFSARICLLGGLLLVPLTSLGIMRLDLRKKCGLSGFNVVYALLLVIAVAAVAIVAATDKNTIAPEGKGIAYTMIFNLLISVIPSIITAIVTLTSCYIPAFERKKAK